MTLTDSERLKFVDYLDECADNAEGIAKQMASLPGPMMEVIAKRERNFAAAYRIVANRLRDVETMSVQPEPSRERQP